MRVVSWNCRSGFHRKLERLAELAPDVAIVSECASLDILASKAPGLQPTSAQWVGTNPHKGLGVFSFGAYQLVRDPDYDPSITYALPVRVEGPSPCHVLALWAHHGLAGRTMATVGPTLSAYHAFLGLEHGAEVHPTFYWRTRAENGPTYHIDYVFVPQSRLTQLNSVVVGSRREWIASGLSDHAPLIVDLDPPFAG